MSKAFVSNTAPSAVWRIQWEWFSRSVATRVNRKVISSILISSAIGRASQLEMAPGSKPDECNSLGSSILPPTAMTNNENKVALALKRLRKVLKRANKKLNDARDKLGDSCTHPEKFVETYIWEHDDGYGSQAKIEGLHCLLCLKSKSWKKMGPWG